MHLLRLEYIVRTSPTHDIVLIVQRSDSGILTSGIEFNAIA